MKKATAPFSGGCVMIAAETLERAVEIDLDELGESYFDWETDTKTKSHFIETRLHQLGFSEYAIVENLQWSGCEGIILKEYYRD